MDNDALRDWSDTQLLTPILGGSVAARLLERFGSLRRLLQASAGDLRSCRGVGRARLEALRALPELARRYYGESLPCGEPIRSPGDTETFLQARLQHLGHEVFCCLFRAIPWHDRRHQRLSARGGQGSAHHQCGGRHPRAQPSERRSRAQPGRRTHYETAKIGPRAGRYSAARSPDRRRRLRHLAGFPRNALNRRL